MATIFGQIFRVFCIQRQPFLKPRFGISLDRVDWAFRLAFRQIAVMNSFMVFAIVMLTT